jgi:hypothetical protein
LIVAAETPEASASSPMRRRRAAPSGSLAPLPFADRLVAVLPADVLSALAVRFAIA